MSRLFIAGLFVLCTANLFAARGGGGGGFHGGVGGEYRGGGEWGNYHPRYYDRRYVDANYYYYGEGAGYYAAPSTYGYYNTAPSPYVYSSPPGVGDDSEQLYQSYLQHNGQGY